MINIVEMTIFCLHLEDAAQLAAVTRYAATAAFANAWHAGRGADSLHRKRVDSISNSECELCSRVHFKSKRLLGFLTSFSSLPRSELILVSMRRTGLL